MKNILDGNWVITGEAISCRYESQGLVVSNPGNEAGSIRLTAKRKPRAGWYTAQLSGSIEERTAGPLYFVDEFNHIMGNASIGSSALFQVGECLELALYVSVPPQCSFTLSRLDLKPAPCWQKSPLRNYCDQILTSKAAVIVPTYPSLENKYLCAFVHSRVKAYQDAGVSVDVICAHNTHGYSAYEYEGVKVLRMPISNLGRLLSKKAYDTVFLHFFDEVFAEQIDGNGLGKTQFVLWSHNPETRYWEWPAFTTPYFTEPIELTDEQKRLFAHRDAILKRFNEKPNVSWVFISQLQKERAEELVGITFNRAHVIPNLVDEERFPFKIKDSAARSRVFCVRKYDNVATYAIDIDVAAVVELSKRDVFSQLEFDFFGDGPLFDDLLAPIAGFDNVHLHRQFLTHDELSEQHATHGIGLFATRFDSQGVSMCEAAASGLAVVSSDIDAANYFLPNDLGLLCPVEDASAYADAIERLATDSDYFEKCSKACHEKVYALCNREMTIDKEIALLQGALE